jgi:hypothetical protein
MTSQAYADIKKAICDAGSKAAVCAGEVEPCTV